MLRKLTGMMTKKRAHAARPAYLYNTLGKEQQKFDLPASVKQVRLYNCGPTVYGVQHIGNLSAAVFADTLRRLLQYDGFSVKQVMNITDFGHLTSDADEGEDKMTKGLRREGLDITMENMKVLAERYTAQFFNDIDTLNVDRSQMLFPRASEHLAAEIAMVQSLMEKGYAYKLDDGVYFDVARFPEYGVLGGVHTDEENAQARVASVSGKHSPNDFALWKFDEYLGWESPWGKGFPGWHIECSAMIRATLGEQIDIHTGGIEHVAIHHNNEIAQSECSTGRKPFSRFWMHRAHIQIEGAKIAKSDGNVVYLSDITDKSIHPLALRYLFLGAHYRTASNFTWNALEAAENAFFRLRAFIDSYPEGGTAPTEYRARISERLNDDLDTPGAIAILWEMVKDTRLTPADIRAGILDADQVLGLGFDKPDEAAATAYRARFGEEVSIDDLPEEVRGLVGERTHARNARDWHRADDLRKELEEMGYRLEDTNGTPRVFKK